METLKKKELISLIFHFDIKRLFDVIPIKQKEREKQFMHLFSLLIERNVPFICIFHSYENPMDFIEKFVEKNDIKRVDVEDCWSKVFPLLAETRNKFVKEFWFISSEPKELISFNETLPALRFSWFFTTQGNNVIVRDEIGTISSQNYNDENLCKVLIVDDFFFGKFRMMILPLQPTLSFSKYARPLTKQDIGKRIARTKHSINFPNQFLTMDSLPIYDIGYCIPWEFVLEDIEFSNENYCKICRKLTNLFCKSCKVVYYCSKTCQNFDWSYHKTLCQSDNVKLPLKLPLNMKVKKVIYPFSYFKDEKVEKVQAKYLQCDWFVIEEVLGLESLLLLKSD